MLNDPIDFANWFGPTWKFHDLDEWINPETGDILTTAELHKLYTQNEEARQKAKDSI